MGVEDDSRGASNGIAAGCKYGVRMMVVSINLLQPSNY